jgi:CheY-like chemotaxis protein
VRLKQVLINLGGNAIKFTERGCVTLRWQLRAREAGRARIRFAVEDTGIGIAPQLQATIFNSFSQGESSTTRRFGGSGLGLTISQRLVTYMGGHIGLVSAPGQGSCFSFEVELLEGHEADLPRIGVVDLNEAGERALEGIRILLVEDNALNQEVAMSILAREGAAMTLAENGLEAVEALRATPSAFDLVLMDMQMPVLDGLRATERIRGELGLSGLPVIAMTANAMTSDRDNCLKAGMNAHIGKPFDLAEVVRTVRRFTRDASLVLPPLAPVPATATEAPREWPVLDEDGALRRLGGNRLLLEQLRSRFGTAAKSLLRQAQARAARGEWGAAADALHQLKGSAGVIGAARLAALCSEAERALRSEGADPGERLGRGRLDGVGTAVQEVLDALGLAPATRPPESDLQGLESVGTPARDEAAHLHSLVALKGLKHLLDAADMEAIDVHEHWLAEHAGARDPRFKRLNACMDRMDLQGAAKECARLLTPLEAVDVVIE